MLTVGKIKNVEDHFVRDAARCADHFLVLISCPGGRPIVKGYICPHCGYDTSYGDCGGVIGFEKRES